MNYISETISIQKSPNVRLGIHLKDNKQGVEIVKIDTYSGSLLKAGDIITHLNEKSIKSARKASTFIIKNANFDMKVLKRELALYTPLLDFRQITD